LAAALSSHAHDDRNYTAVFVAENKFVNFIYFFAAENEIFAIAHDSRREKIFLRPQLSFWYFPDIAQK
jgi:hypothetical protein